MSKRQLACRGTTLMISGLAPPRGIAGEAGSRPVCVPAMLLLGAWPEIGLPFSAITSACRAPLRPSIQRDSW